ncbi:hypothetical protein MycrhDRAFT_5752 [Mycolicibacterium rhodesiae JS60]|nr:hypothetical protein MycrhDRAFT_5752 [Mycolicibacterium rhodesiae JS60]
MSYQYSPFYGTGQVPEELAHTVVGTKGVEGPSVNEEKKA